MKYRCILIDPPWPLELVTGGFTRRRGGMGPAKLPYPTLSIDAIRSMTIPASDNEAHLWMWTTDAFLPIAFDIMRDWGFKYLAPIHWIKPSGCGVWFVRRVQTLLFGYRSPLRMLKKPLPNIINDHVNFKHSRKPEAARLIETVSPGPRLEMFARTKRQGWHAWGNEVKSDIQYSIAPLKASALNPATNTADCGPGPGRDSLRATAS